jgi:hypothetical protein
VEYEREVYALLVEAERQIQMGAEEFGAAVVTLQRALTLDGANKEAWAALDRVAFVLGGRIYAAGDDGRLDLAGQELGREGVAELARWLATDAGAVVADLNISMNPIGVDGAKALGDVISRSSLKCLIIGPEGTRLPVNNDDVTELNFEGQEFGPAEVTLVAAATSTLAALNSLTVDSTGEEYEYRKTYTLTASEDKIQLSQKNLGSADVALLAAWMQRPEVSAALTEVDVRSNRGLDEAAVAALRAAAPETCKILADY